MDALKEKGTLDLSILNGDATNVVAKLGSDFMGYSGHKHQKGNKIVTIQDNAGNVLASMTIASVNQSDITLLPDAPAISHVENNYLQTKHKLHNPEGNCIAPFQGLW